MMRFILKAKEIFNRLFVENSLSCLFLFLMILCIGFYPPIKKVLLLFSILMGSIWVMYAYIRTDRKNKEFLDFTFT